MNIEKKLLDEALGVLIHDVGDNRFCPHCKKGFVPDDRTSQDAHSLFRRIKALLSGGRA
jgi:hypothetical protein